MTILSERDLRYNLYSIYKESCKEKTDKKGSGAGQNKRRQGFDASKLNIDLILYDSTRKFERFIFPLDSAEKSKEYNIFGERRTRVFREETTFISR
mgnify:CR=1 FL=1